MVYIKLTRSFSIEIHRALSAYFFSKILAHDPGTFQTEKSRAKLFKNSNQFQKL